MSSGPWCRTTASSDLMGDDRKEVEWDDDFAPRETRRFRWDLIADQLRQRPGRWAKVVGSGGRQLTQPAVDGRGSLCPVPMRAGRWQVATRHGELWIRYLGEDERGGR